MAEPRVLTPMMRDALMLAGATALVLLSAAGVVYSVYMSRQMVNELQSLQRQSDELQVQWGQLLLEKSTWGSYPRVEQTARSHLGMYLPTVQEIVVVQP